MLYPYKMGSNSAAALSAAMKTKQIRHEGSKFRGSPDKVVINWGASSMPEEVKKCTILNAPEAVEIASNKKKFFEKVQGKVKIPEFTSDKDQALHWLNEGFTVVGRSKLNGHSGEGIILYESITDMDANSAALPLYVKYIPKKDEYRVHVVGDSVVDVRRKALKSDRKEDGVNWKIRNLNNGFIFAKQGLDVPEDVISQSVLAVKEAGLDFGAVDVIWNNHRQSAYVLEINTAPGLEGSTIDSYASGFAKFLFENPKTKAKKFGGSIIDQALMDQFIAITNTAFVDIETSDSF